MEEKMNASKSMKKLRDFIEKELEGCITAYNFIDFLINECSFSVSDIPDEYLKQKYLKEQVGVKKKVTYIRTR